MTTLAFASLRLASAELSIWEAPVYFSPEYTRL